MLLFGLDFEFLVLELVILILRAGLLLSLVLRVKKNELTENLSLVILHEPPLAALGCVAAWSWL